MAVGLDDFPLIPEIKGIRIGVAEAGIKRPNKKDVVIFELCEGASVAGVFTQNAFCAAPVRICQRHLGLEGSRYLLINTGNANAGTGKSGLATALKTCDALAAQVGVNVESILPFSTGVIGEPLPADKIIAAIPAALANLSPDNWHSAGVGIMTTDTLPKGSVRTFDFDGRTYTIAGISKGAGMIRPNMATMLGYIGSDIAMDVNLLQIILKSVVNKSFNRITVDSDTSTNDSCIAVVTGMAGNTKVTSIEEPLAQAFIAAFTEVMQELAHAIVRDGEGATKFVTVEVAGAAKQSDATKTAFEIAHSPLVKTALFASDPNWGRILAVVGRAGVENLDVDCVQLHINGFEIARDGGRSPDYREEHGKQAMAPEEIHIIVDLGMGDASDVVWTTDFSHEYVTINAEYRT
ncbi:bifunctional glutamate N-acetyltransferase/amino-acid acetyltransferase ArgJ [Marinomonas sp. M1K-6]|uniref:Arginine biosynthesis bifunctional protein ArgJ n=1 Tax=Marinomonas profundi TaxID=2726122 RepID=A0A847R3K3_9GAMM|nr:bifunctional glutamate N-acetyltransferase/amino-acid acetyltransferase ArgJ [Marinomonas profundi]NLQ18492.1 bifunctional glutamate N-acetyltransferase/amino-acid acetyltransferase ArgJ [Marinomonas profundi]UDV02809.1 bifunctional glutamate N-acetyltransferase/amino-acid acetyltransferase ArgJ [Marinomonas profundi]